MAHEMSVKIIPYTIQKRDYSDNIFIKIRILCEGGRTIWTESRSELDNIGDLFVDFELKLIKQFNPINTSLFLYEVSDNDIIQSWTELPHNSTDLCWRNYILILHKSENEQENAYFHYLPCPNSLYLDEIKLSEIFEYILKVSYNIIIE